MYASASLRWGVRPDVGPPGMHRLRNTTNRRMSLFQRRAPMSDDAFGATVAKRRLSLRLAELRGGTGYTANHVCDILNWGRGKVGRFEANQWKRPEMSDIRDLLRIYDVADSEREQLEELAIQARARPWWRDYSDIFENEFPGFENDAQRIHVCMPLVVPGLLQT